MGDVVCGLEFEAPDSARVGDLRLNGEFFHWLWRGRVTRRY